MRDQEFLAAMKKMAPILSKRFHFLAIRAKVRDDRKSFVQDLLSLTMLEALVNSRKEIHLAFSCEQLIRVKASNVWAEYWKQRKTTFNHSNHEELKLDWQEDRHIEEAYKADTKLDWLIDKADEKTADILKKRLENYEVNEIAEMYGKTPGSITMQIQRLKQKIKKRP
jgi:DNA-directed RNA polymerase specialized sigma24 family protein